MLAHIDAIYVGKAYLWGYEVATPAHILVTARDLCAEGYEYVLFLCREDTTQALRWAWIDHFRDMCTPDDAGPWWSPEDYADVSARTQRLPSGSLTIATYGVAGGPYVPAGIRHRCPQTDAMAHDGLCKILRDAELDDAAWVLVLPDWDLWDIKSQVACASDISSTYDNRLTGIQYCPFCGIRLPEEDVEKGQVMS